MLLPPSQFCNLWKLPQSTMSLSDAKLKSFNQFLSMELFSSLFLSFHATASFHSLLVLSLLFFASLNGKSKGKKLLCHREKLTQWKVSSSYFGWKTNNIAVDETLTSRSSEKSFNDYNAWDDKVIVQTEISLDSFTCKAKYTMKTANIFLVSSFHITNHEKLYGYCLIVNIKTILH